MMWLILSTIGAIVVCVACGIFYKIEDERCWDSGPVIFLIISAVSGAVACIGLIVCLLLGFDYKAASVKAELINREYDTHYTQEEIFYAEDVVDTIREIQRSRIDVRVKEEKSE